MARARKGKSAPSAGGTGAATDAARTARARGSGGAARQNAEQARTARRDSVSRWLDTAEEYDVRAFIAARSAQMDQRKYQMSLIKDFVADPSRFGLSHGDIPTSTSLEEFAERRSELDYRIAIVKTFLDLLTEELGQLDLAEAYARGKRQPRKPRPR